MAHKSPRYCLYREFVDASMKGHYEMTRCTSHHSAQAEWNQIKRDEGLVKAKIKEYLGKWDEAGRPECRNASKKSSEGSKTDTGDTSTRTSRKRTRSSDDDDEPDPNYDSDAVEPVTPTFSKRPPVSEIDDEKPWLVRSVEKAAKKKAQAAAKSSATVAAKSKTPVQEAVLIDLKEISERIANLLQVKSMGLFTNENQKTLKKLIEQKQRRTADLKRLQSKQRASTRYRERKRRRVEQLCAAHPDVAAELSRSFRPAAARTQIAEDCPDLLQIIAEIARVGGATNGYSQSDKTCLSLDDLKDAIKQRGYEIHKSSLYYRLMPHRSLSYDGKKHVATVPVRLSRMHGISPLVKHADCHFAAATLRHVKDLAGIFGNDCVFYLTQNTRAKVNIGRPLSKGNSPLIMHLDYQMNSVESALSFIAPRHQLTPSVYAGSIIDETGLVSNAGPTYIALRSAKHDHCTHETHAVDFDRLVHSKEFEKVALDHVARVKPIVIVNIDTSGSENNTRYPKTLATAMDRFKKYDLDVLVMINQAPGQNLFNVVERRLSPLSHDLAGLILPHDHFGTHLNESGLTENAGLELGNFKRTGDVLAEVWSMNVLDEYPVLAEYIQPSSMLDEQWKMSDSKFTLSHILDRVCIDEDEEKPLGQRVHYPSIPTPVTIKAECDIDEYWCATHVLQTQYTIQIIRCNNPLCCSPWRSNYAQVFPHRFLPPTVPFHRSSRGVTMADTESSSASNNAQSPFYGNLFQRIQFHGIVINRTKNDLLPFDACCPSLQTILSSRVCSICKQYIPSPIRLRNHCRIHQEQYRPHYLDVNNDMYKEEDIVDDIDMHDPYERLAVLAGSTQMGVCLFTNMFEWLKSEFEDDPVVDTKVQSTAAKASAMIRKEKQTTVASPAPITVALVETKPVLDDTQCMIIGVEDAVKMDPVTENSSMRDAVEQLTITDESAGPIEIAPSQEGWDDLEDLIDQI